MSVGRYWAVIDAPVVGIDWDDLVTGFRMVIDRVEECIAEARLAEAVTTWWVLDGKLGDT